MIYTVSVIAILILALIYTVSYGVYEYKSRNIPAAAGVFALCALAAVIAFFTLWRS